MEKKIKQSAYLFSASAAITTLAAIGLFKIWYPYPLNIAVGISYASATPIALSLVMGWLVFRKNGSAQKTNQNLLACLPIAFNIISLAVTAAIILNSRPVWIVFNIDRFDVTQARDVDRRFLSDTPMEFRSSSWMGPLWVASSIPKDVERRNQLILESSIGGSDLPQRPDLFSRLGQERIAIQSRARPLDELEKYNSLKTVNEAMARWPKASAWLPLMAREKPMVVLLNTEEGRPLAIVNLHPWIEE